MIASFRDRFTPFRSFRIVVPLATAMALACPRPIDAEEDDTVQPEGGVGLRELIELALQNDPGLIALRSNLPVEEARKRAAVQWRDPEIRLGISKDDNLQLDQPYTRSGSVTEAVTRSGTSGTVGSFSGTDQQRGADGGPGTTSQLRSTSQSGDSTETRTTTFTEKVIPGRDSDRIIRTETERRQIESNQTERSVESERRRTASGATNRNSRGVSREQSSGSEVVRTTTDETRYHGFDRYARDQTASVRVRFWIPKPWEMKALVNQAATQVDLANYEITAAERRVILGIREQYEALQYLHKKLEASRGRITLIEKHVANEKALLDAGGAFTLDKLSFEDIKIPGIQLAIDAAEAELDAAKRQLAARVGLADGSRIRLSDKLLRSSIDLQATDLEYLVRMAFAHRGEVGILKHEQAIAEAELDVVKSKRIPWFSFIEAAYAQDSTGGTYTNDNYGVQVGVVLPLFSWLAKDAEVVEARINSYGASLEANQKNIANEVAEAFRSVKEATSYRSRTEAALAQHAAMLETRARGLDAAEDPAAKERLRYDAAIERNKFQEYLLAADRLYNRSLIRLEQALGADLDQVFKVQFEPADDSYDVVVASARGSSDGEPLPAPLPVPAELESKTEEAAEETKRKGFFGFLKGNNGDSKTVRRPGARTNSKW